MGPLTKLATSLVPSAGKIYNESLSFGQSLPRHNDNGPGDAARHAYASALAAKEYGPLIAKILGDGYELTSFNQDRRSQAMDEINNARGRELYNLPEAQLKEVILGMLNDGQLKTLRKGEATQDYANGGLIPGNQETWEPVGTGYILR